MAEDDVKPTTSENHLFQKIKEYHQRWFVDRCLSEDELYSDELDADAVNQWRGNLIHHLRQDKVNRTVRNFISHSTCHGFSYCMDKEHIFRRMIWMLMVGSSVCFLFQKLHQSTTKYFSYPFTTKNTIKYCDKQDFPAVSICNLNDLRLSKLKGTLLHQVLETRKQTGGELNLSSFSDGQYHITTLQAGHQIEHMLVKCEMLGVPCTSKNFTYFHQTQGDCCYTINGRYSKIANVDKNKRHKSLILELNIENYEYYDVETAGLRLILHDQKETPVDMRGILLPPGFTSLIEIKKLKTLNLQKPYKTNCGSIALHYFTHYSQSACELEMLTLHLVSKCHCKVQFMPGDGRICSVKELANCTWPTWEKFAKLPSKCPLACETVHFEPMVSFGQYPSNALADAKAKEFGLQGNVQENRMFIRDNFLRVEISYGSMTYSVTEQSPSYDLMVLVSDIGGQLGLFLGTSILTYAEFFDLIIMVIYTKYFERFTRRDIRVP